MTLHGSYDVVVVGSANLDVVLSVPAIPSRGETVLASGLTDAGVELQWVRDDPAPSGTSSWHSSTRAERWSKVLRAGDACRTGA